jgi:hypothetical protein
MLSIKNLLMANYPAIVLTGTIIPNVLSQHRHLDESVRRAEYLQAIRFYSQFSSVYFLENSGYPLQSDPEFTGIQNLRICQFPVSAFREQGRGFQEFEMLDRWVTETQDLPASWLKITGRYKYENIQQILQECQPPKSPAMLVNQYRFSGYTNPAIFYITSAYYGSHIAGLYQQCDDRTGQYIEKVLHSNLRQQSPEHCQRFRSPLLCSGIAGSSGREMSNPLRDRLNALIADANYWFDKKYLWLSF